MTGPACTWTTSKRGPIITELGLVLPRSILSATGQGPCTLIIFPSRATVGHFTYSIMTGFCIGSLLQDEIC
jgi:hypothetical protein